METHCICKPTGMILFMVQKSPTSTVWMYKALVDNGINYLPTGAGFLPSTVLGILTLPFKNYQEAKKCHCSRAQQEVQYIIQAGKDLNGMISKLLSLLSDHQLSHTVWHAAASPQKAPQFICVSISPNLTPCSAGSTLAKPTDGKSHHAKLSTKVSQIWPFLSLSNLLVSFNHLHNPTFSGAPNKLTIRCQTGAQFSAIHLDWINLDLLNQPVNKHTYDILLMEEIPNNHRLDV